MLYNLILNYSKKISVDDIKLFAKKNNYILCDKDANIICQCIKEDTNVILDDPKLYLDKIKDKLEYTTYLKLNELLSTYSNFLYH